MRQGMGLLLQHLQAVSLAIAITTRQNGGLLGGMYVHMYSQSCSIEVSPFWWILCCKKSLSVCSWILGWYLLIRASHRWFLPVLYGMHEGDGGGWMAFEYDVLPRLDKNNRQKEYGT